MQYYDVDDGSHYCCFLNWYWSFLTVQDIRKEVMVVVGVVDVLVE
jgi:hypothetical protein